MRTGRGVALLGCAPVSLWLSKKLLRVVQERLAEGPDGPIAVVDLPHMRRALDQAGCEIAELAEDTSVQVGALIVAGAASAGQWQQTLAMAKEHIKAGGQLVSVDKGDAAEVSRRLLCGGLSDLTQRSIGRRLVTSGVVPR